MTSVRTPNFSIGDAEEVIYKKPRRKVLHREFVKTSTLGNTSIDCSQEKIIDTPPKEKVHKKVHKKVHESTQSTQSIEQKIEESIKTSDELKEGLRHLDFGERVGNYMLEHWWIPVTILLLIIILLIVVNNKKKQENRNLNTNIQKSGEQIDTTEKQVVLLRNELGKSLQHIKYLEQLSMGTHKPTPSSPIVTIEDLTEQHDSTEQTEQTDKETPESPPDDKMSEADQQEFDDVMSDSLMTITQSAHDIALGPSPDTIPDDLDSADGDDEMAIEDVDEMVIEDIDGMAIKEPESVPIPVEPQTEEQGCCYIFTRGKRVGEPCGKPISHNNLCTLHYGQNSLYTPPVE